MMSNGDCTILKARSVFNLLNFRKGWPIRLRFKLTSEDEVEITFAKDFSFVKTKTPVDRSTHIIYKGSSAEKLTKEQQLQMSNEFQNLSNLFFGSTNINSGISIDDFLSFLLIYTTGRNLKDLVSVFFQSNK